MSTADLKKQVLSKLETADDQLLKEVLALIEFETTEEVYKTTDSEREAIKEAHKQIKNGEYLSDEEVNKDIDSWLKE